MCGRTGFGVIHKVTAGEILTVWRFNVAISGYMKLLFENFEILAAQSSKERSK
jgi:hypothetical protein